MYYNDINDVSMFWKYFEYLKQIALISVLKTSSLKIIQVFLNTYDNAIKYIFLSRSYRNIY